MTAEQTVNLLEKNAFRIRSHIIKTIVTNGEGHAGPSLSCADILSVLYTRVMRIDPRNPGWPERDRFILSAGHKCLALYAALLEAGFIDEDTLATYNKLHTLVPGHPDRKKTKGVDFSSGALGHGLPAGCGMALGAKLSGASFKTYVLMGDGEHGEGSIWEAASFAAHKGLDNLIAIVDRNGLQINGTTKQVADTSPLEERYRSFGWAVRVIDGHDVAAILDTLNAAPFSPGKPSVIIANTIKGKGLSFAENNFKYHHWNPNKEQARTALEELQEYGSRWN